MAVLKEGILTSSNTLVAMEIIQYVRNMFRCLFFGQPADHVFSPACTYQSSNHPIIEMIANNFRRPFPCIPASYKLLPFPGVINIEKYTVGYNGHKPPLFNAVFTFFYRFAPEAADRFVV